MNKHGGNGNPDACERVEMSARLLRWLDRASETPTQMAPASLAEAAQQHALWGGFVDWARNTLLGGEPERELADAYVQLLSQGARDPRAAERAFRDTSARLDRRWIQAGRHCSH